MEMKEINKIVQLSDLQYEKLLKDRQIEINGEIKVWEPDTLYVTPNNNYQWLFNKFYEAAVKPNEVYHTPMNMKSLEQEYEDLIDENNILAYTSAIGYTAILKNNDTIRVTEPNKGIFYINGSVMTNDYSYTGDGYEVVNVWVFESKIGDLIVAPTLADAPTFIINKLIIKNIAQKPNVNDSYILYANEIELDNFVLSTAPLTTKTMTDKGKYNFNQVVGNFVTEYTDESITIDSDKLVDKSKLEKINFPNLEVISMKTTSYDKTFLCNCNNPKLEIIFPKLKQILTSDYATISYRNAHPFREVYKVVLPESVEVIQKGICIENSEIHLNCKNATSIDNNWCNTTPTVNFTMCKDWGASINIAIAAKNHNKEWFIDLFTNYLKDFSKTNEIREICIPIIFFETMTEEELTLAKNKNWTVTGA